MLPRLHAKRFLNQIRMLRKKILGRSRDPANLVAEICFRLDEIGRDKGYLRSETMKPRRLLSAKRCNVIGHVFRGRVETAEYELVPGPVVPPEGRCLLTRRDCARVSENPNPRSSLDTVPAPVALTGRPLFLNRFQGRRDGQPGAGASARRQQLPPTTRNAPGEKLASSLLHVGLARDRERGELAERADLLRMQPRLIKQFAVVRNRLVCVQEKGSQPSVAKLADIVGIGKCPRLVLFEQPSESAAANSEVVMPPDRALRRVLKRDRKMRI